MNRFFILLFLSLRSFAQTQVEIEPPAAFEITKLGPNGTAVLPNGRKVAPLGFQVKTAPHPFGLCLSKDGDLAVTANSGINPFSINIISGLKTGKIKNIQIPEKIDDESGVLEACFMGLAISHDNAKIYVSGGETNAIHIFDAYTGRKLDKIDCSRPNQTHGYLGDLVMTASGNELWVVDQINFEIFKVDLAQKKIVEILHTGRYPFGISLSPNQKHLSVANVGVFEYKLFTDLDKNNIKNTAHRWPSSKYGSTEMLNGIPDQGVPALGDPNDDAAFSVWVYNLENKTDLKKVKTGFLVGQKIEGFEAVGGSSPNSLVSTNQKIYVSNGNNDCVSVIDINTGKLDNNIDLQLHKYLGKLKGAIPFGLALNTSKNHLYVCLAGINALGVINTVNNKVLGFIPTGWFPSKVAINEQNNTLLVANAKGQGSGPNGGKNFKLGAEGSYIGNLMKGSVSVFTVPNLAELAALTKKVQDLNFRIKPQTKSSLDKIIPSKPLVGSENIKHIVFISKENRTFDEVFGQLKNANGDSSLSRFGLNRTVKNKSKDSIVTKAQVMPNHIALAKRFAIADNFYCDSDLSADGHRWLVNTYPNEWVETSTAASYGGKRNLNENSNAPGNYAIYGSAGSIYPEDYNEAGSLWDHMERHKKTFYNFGFGVEMAAAFADSTMKEAGERYLVNYPLTGSLFDNSSRTFPTYNMAIPDQYRADVFMKEFNQKWGNGSLPSLLTLQLPNDHGSKERPAAGWHFQESYMADNDLALGRVVAFLSQTPYWKNMLIVVTEDDPQGGVDHVDAHRSLLMLISPYVKKNFVAKKHYSFGSIFKTFWKIFGLPYLNQYDATAADLSEAFTDKPDFKPFRAVTPDLRIFNPQKTLDPLDEKFDWKALTESEEMDKTETMQKRRAEDDKHNKKP